MAEISISISSVLLSFERVWCTQGKLYCLFPEAYSEYCVGQKLYEWKSKEES